MSKFYIRMYKDGRLYRTAGGAGSTGANMHHLEMILRGLLDEAQDHPDGHLSHVYRFELVRAKGLNNKRVYYTKDIEVVNRTSDRNGNPELPAYINVIKGPENPINSIQYRIRVFNETTNKVLRVDECPSRDESYEALEKIQQWVYRQSPTMTKSQPNVSYRIELVEEMDGVPHVFDTHRVVFRHAKRSDFNSTVEDSQAALPDNARKIFARTGDSSTIIMIDD